MKSEEERLEELENAYRKLWEQHQQLKNEIKTNYAEVAHLRESLGLSRAELVQETQQPVSEPVASQNFQNTSQQASPQPPKTSWESYIGEQLLSKIGIAILIIGVGIGAKYAIDKQLLGPEMRVFLGYLVAGVLGFFAWKFRTKYESFSAVLISGALAVTYFITYAAHVFFPIFPYSLTFILLFLTTAGAVAAALRYNQVVIAHIGLIGAYILPALIANKPAHLSNYLLYMTIINLGILFISFLRDWKSLYYVAFWWTMIVFPVWFFTSYSEKADAPIALIYSIGYFILFHTAALAYQLRKRENFSAGELFLIIPNVLVFLAISTYIVFAADYSDHSGFYLSTALGAVLIAVWAVFRSIRPTDEMLQNSHLLIGVSVLLIAMSAYHSTSGSFALLLRYVDFAAIVGLLWITMRRYTAHAGFVTLLHLLMIWALSVEITSILNATGNRNSYKLTLSLIWGIYAIYLLFSGIKRKLTALRVTAMIILGITLFKVFFLDIVKMSTISKTVLFMGLGGMLLVAAYLYQKFNREEKEVE